MENYRAEGDRKMRRKGLKRIAAVMMAVLLMVCGSVEPLHAADNSANDGIMLLSMDATKSVSLTISSGTAKAACTVAGTSKTIGKIEITLYLQKKNSSGVWITYKSWSSTKNSYINSLSKSCSVPSGIYRARAKVVCTKGSKIETSYLNTGEKIRK